MSKKEKSKFRRRLKAQIIQEFGKSTPVQPKTIESPKAPLAELQTEKQEKEESPKILPTPEPLPEIQNDALTWVRRDLKKSAFIIGSIIILIVVLFFIDQKTDILLKAGNGIFKVLHIGA